MGKILLKKGLCFVVILLLTMMSTIPIAVSTSEKSLSQKSTVKNGGSGDNLLAVANISWWFWPIIPLVEFPVDPSGKNFKFPVDNEGYAKLNFTVEWKHRLLTRLIFNFRFTHFEFSIYEGIFPNHNWVYDKHYTNWQNGGFEDCKDTGWENFTIYIDQNDEYDPGWKYDSIFIGNTTKNLTVKFTITGFPPFYCIIPDLISWKYEFMISPFDEDK